MRYGQLCPYLTYGAREAMLQQICSIFDSGLDSGCALKYMLVHVTIETILLKFTAQLSIDYKSSYLAYILLHQVG